MIICLVTDRRRLAPAAPDADRRRCLLRQSREAVAAGVELLHVREPDLEAGALVDLVREIRVVARDSRTRVVVNDRLDVALAAGADGVHLRADSFDWRAVRRLAPAPFIVGCSVHSVEEARAADGASYLVAGTVWQSASKSEGHRLLGVDGLAAIVRAVASPVLAIGGVTLHRVTAVAKSGAAGIAAIGLFMDEEMPECRAVSLHSVVAAVRRPFNSDVSAES